MGYRPRTQSREYREGWTGRRRNYKCRKCGIKFQHDGQQLPEDSRICPPCWEINKINRENTDNDTGE